MAKRSLTIDEIQNLLFDEENCEIEDINNLNGNICEDNNDNDIEHDNAEISVENKNSDSENSDNDEPVANVQPIRHRKKLTYNRIVKNLETSLDNNSYDPVPSSNEEEIYKCILKKGTKNTPENIIYWTNERPINVGRQHSSNVIKTKQCLINGSETADSKRKVWELFMTKEMVKKIVACTNIQIEKVRLSMNTDIRENIKIKSYIKNTTLEEMIAYQGLLYARGMLNLSKQNCKNLYEDEIGHPIFGATMSYHRFVFLSSNIRFDNINTRQERFIHDRFAAFREIFEDFNNRCSSVLQPDEYLSIDETLYGCKNQISFKQYNSSKPQKYGLLFKSVNAVKYPFTFRTSVYSGKPIGEPGPYYISGIMPGVQSLVTQLSNFVDLQGRNITMDRLYTSFELLQ